LDIVARYGETGFAIIIPSGGKNIDLVRARMGQQLHNWVSGRYGNTGAVRTLVGEAVSPGQARSGFEMILLAESQHAAASFKRAA
jgi:GGDEF domain-containing protein